jgi:hypothetical protein
MRPPGARPGWTSDHANAWAFGGHKNVSFPPEEWRKHAGGARGIKAALWCALGSDDVIHQDGKQIQASRLEYGHGGGHQHWLASMHAFVGGSVAEANFARILAGERDENMRAEVQAICRWDAACNNRTLFVIVTRTVILRDRTRRSMPSRRLVQRVVRALPGEQIDHPQTNAVEGADIGEILQA